MDGDPEFLTLEVVIKDTTALYEAYMSFLKTEDYLSPQRKTLYWANG